MIPMSDFLYFMMLDGQAALYAITAGVVLLILFDGGFNCATTCSPSSRASSTARSHSRPLSIC
jgi:hypothetical protein